MIVKRTMDVVVAAILLVVLAPVFAIVAVLVRFSSSGPVLFRQERVGRRDQPFTMLKFRTMRVGGDDHALRELIRREIEEGAAPVDGSTKLADPRITRIGRFLRRTSLDELPQLINVLRGEMSLVGPRPALPWEAELFPAPYRRRTAVRPGITGLWQVNGRSLVGTLEMLELDLRYVDERSLRLDLVILVRTVTAVLRGDGAR